MMSKVIVFKRHDGQVSVVRPAANARLIYVPCDNEGDDPQVVPAFTIAALRDEPAFLAAAAVMSPDAFAETEVEFLARVMARSVPEDAIDPAIIDEDSLPPRDFRDAYALKSGKIDIDMTKAREVHRERLRQMRKPKLEALDIAYQRADERGDTAAKADIAGQKQALRDVTELPAIDAAANVYELRAAIPEALRPAS